MKVFLTGATGPICGVMVVTLRATGHELLGLQDLPNAEIHLLETGQFALEAGVDTMAELLDDFMDRVSKPTSLQ